MASSSIDLYLRVEQAESAWEAGDSATAFDAFVSLLHAAGGMLCLRQSIYRDAAERELFQTTAYLARALQTHQRVTAS